LLSIDAFPKAVPVFFQSPQIGFQQPEYSLSFPCADPGGLNTNYEALLPVHQATCFGDMFLDATKVLFHAHAKLTRWAVTCACGLRVTEWHGGLDCPASIMPPLRAE
jgi:hypothetical protein